MIELQIKMQIEFVLQTIAMIKLEIEFLIQMILELIKQIKEEIESALQLALQLLLAAIALALKIAMMIKLEIERIMKMIIEKLKMIKLMKIMKIVFELMKNCGNFPALVTNYLKPMLPDGAGEFALTMDMAVTAKGKCVSWGNLVMRLELAAKCDEECDNIVRRHHLG